MRNSRRIGTVPLQSPQLAVRELERCMDELGLQGVQIGSHVGVSPGQHWNLDAPELFEFFEAASELGAAILVHPWDMMGSESMPKYWMPWLVGMPAEQSRAACALIFGGVLEKFPRLKICLAHGGGSFPYTIGRIEHGFSGVDDGTTFWAHTEPGAAPRAGSDHAERSTLPCLRRP